MNSKVYYGHTFLENTDLINSKIKNRIELEYYRTKKQKNLFLSKDNKSYGIEIVKKEYEGKRINIEKEKVDRITDTINSINSILDKLKKFKVTPIALKDVLEDMTLN